MCIDALKKKESEFCLLSFTLYYRKRKTCIITCMAKVCLEYSEKKFNSAAGSIGKKWGLYRLCLYKFDCDYGEL